MSLFPSSLETPISCPSSSRISLFYLLYMIRVWSPGQALFALSSLGSCWAWGMAWGQPSRGVCPGPVPALVHFPVSAATDGRRDWSSRHGNGDHGSWILAALSAHRPYQAKGLDATPAGQGPGLCRGSQHGTWDASHSVVPLPVPSHHDFTSKTCSSL